MPWPFNALLVQKTTLINHPLTSIICLTPALLRLVRWLISSPACQALLFVCPGRPPSGHKQGVQPLPPPSAFSIAPLQWCFIHPFTLSNTNGPLGVHLMSRWRTVPLQSQRSNLLITRAPLYLSHAATSYHTFVSQVEARVQRPFVTIKRIYEQLCCITSQYFFKWLKFSSLHMQRCFSAGWCWIHIFHLKLAACLCYLM